MLDQPASKSSPDGEGRKRKPRYKALASVLLDGIRARRFPIGSLLPTEGELAEQHDVSRHTVRQALQQLQQVGLVESEHGVGSRVIGRATDNRYVMVLNGISDFWRYVQETTIQVLRVDRASLGEAPLCNADHKLPAEWILIEGVRCVKSTPTEPVVWSRLFLNPAYQKLVKSIGRTRVPLWARIERQFDRKLAVVHQEISAVEIPKDAAKLLNVAPGSIGLKIVRWYVDDTGALMEVASNLHPANRFRFSSAISMQFVGSANNSAP